MTDSREMRAVPLGLTATYAPPTQGSDKARETRLVSPLGFDGAVPLGEFRTGANYQSRRRMRIRGNHQSRRDGPIKARGKARRASRALTQPRVRSTKRR